MKRTITALLSTLAVVASLGISAACAQEQEIATDFKYSDPSAKKVEVAGEFSNWKILPMINDGAGHWTTTLHLKPGFYGYKLVVNGEWILDPANPTRKSVSGIDNSGISVGGVQPTATPSTAPVSGGAGAGKVPVTFAFTDATAKTVHLAGEFNSWLDNEQGRVTGHAEWQLQNDGVGNWKLTTPLAPGKYKFKYVVDGGDRWEKDKTLPASADDNSLVEVKAGGEPAGSAVASGKTSVTFTYSNPSAKSVHVAGKFNNWLDNDQGRVTGHNEWMMTNDGAGNWSLTVSIAPGRYPFKYVVDGGDHWEQDPKLPASADGNSLVEVKGDGGRAGATVAPSAGGVSFTYSDASANTVAVAGEFNQWSATANPMQKDASGTWTATIPLKPGRYQYKFVVDGSNWREDTGNPEKADDGLGGKNSVKVVAP